MKVLVRRAIHAIAIAVVLLAWGSTAGYSQKKKSEDASARSVQGIVASPKGDPVEGAVVQLKNSKTLQIRSFITPRDGSYYFHGLSPDVDFELRAEFKDMASSVRRLSVFDSRRKLNIDLKLEPQK